MTEHEFINHEIHLWGFEAVEELLDKGFQPTKLLTADNREVWRWVQKPLSRTKPLIAA